MFLQPTNSGQRVWHGPLRAQYTKDVGLLHLPACFFSLCFICTASVPSECICTAQYNAEVRKLAPALQALLSGAKTHPSAKWSLPMSCTDLILLFCPGPGHFTISIPQIPYGVEGGEERKWQHQHHYCRLLWVWLLVFICTGLAPERLLSGPGACCASFYMNTEQRLSLIQGPPTLTANSFNF